MNLFHVCLLHIVVSSNPARMLRKQLNDLLIEAVSSAVDLRIPGIQFRRPPHVKVIGEGVHSHWFSNFHPMRTAPWQSPNIPVAHATKTVHVNIVGRSPVAFTAPMHVTKAEFKSLVCSRFQLDSCDSLQIVLSCSGKVKLFIGTLRDMICQETIAVYLRFA